MEIIVCTISLMLNIHVNYVSLKLTYYHCPTLVGLGLLPQHLYYYQPLHYHHRTLLNQTIYKLYHFCNNVGNMKKLIFLFNTMYIIILYLYYHTNFLVISLRLNIFNHIKYLYHTHINYNFKY